jgi:uncharacterized coiled-coil DUF342 family protein
MSALKDIIASLSSLQGKGDDLKGAAQEVKLAQQDLIVKQKQLIDAVETAVNVLSRSQESNDQLKEALESAQQGQQTQQELINQVMTILKGSPTRDEINAAAEALGVAAGSLTAASAQPRVGGYKRSSTRGEELVSSSRRKTRSGRSSKKSKKGRTRKGGRNTVHKEKKARGKRCGCGF